MFKFSTGFVKDESGVTAMEYALIAACVFIVIIGAVQAVGGEVTGMWNIVAAAF